jgi:hypothetical protein
MKWIEDSKAIHLMAEQEVSNAIPAQFIAFSEGDDEDREKFTVRICPQWVQQSHTLKC